MANNFEFTEENYKSVKKLHDAPLDSRYFERWRTIRDSYKHVLDDGVIFKNIAYTPHDYKRHCVNIYRILDWLIPEKAYDMLTFEELFILNISVILHDYIMSKDIDERNVHGVAAAESLDKIFKTERDSVIKLNLDDIESNCVKHIIRGHSDIKDKQNNILEKTMNNVPSVIIGSYGDIRVKLLAGLLRLADELDICFKRIDGIDFTTQNMGEGEEGIKSKKHWRACDIFTYPSKSNNNTAISLNLLIDKIIKTIGEEPSDEDITIIKNVHKKINEELIDLNEIVFNNENLTDWRYTKVILSTDNAYIQAALTNEKKK